MTVFKWKRVAIDLDDTLIQGPGSTYTTDDYFRSKLHVPAIAGAMETTSWLRSQGFEITIFTCRPDYQRKYVEEILNRELICWDHIMFYGKPHADLYIDNKGFRFNTWKDTRSWIENTLKDDDMNGIVQQA